MDYLLDILTVVALVALALIGHAALWVSLVNRLNAFAFPHHMLRWINRVCLFACAVIPMVPIAAGLATALILRAAGIWHHLLLSAFAQSFAVILVVYIGLCWIVGAWAISIWLVRRFAREETLVLVRANHTQRFDVAAARGESLAGNRKVGVCARIPGNQLFQFQTQTKDISLPGLPAALDGFSIAHLSDLHFAGHIRREFYDEVVRQTNLLDADLIAITGDIIDRPQCFEWLAGTLGQLHARMGVYFILGNHDSRRTSPDDVRRALVDLGLVDLGGRYQATSHNGAEILLAGNELPWHKAPPEIGELPVNPNAADVLSILLSHSPDQFARAQREGYKLMLAGHVHGGQIRPPLVGPMLSPSRYGVRYASGIFHRAPTLMHVTRGVSGMIPLRFNCPPEVAKLVLQTGAT